MDELLKELDSITVNRQPWLSNEVGVYCATHKRLDCGMDFNPTVGTILHRCRCPMVASTTQKSPDAHTDSPLARMEALESSVIIKIGGFREVPLGSNRQQLIKLRLCTTPHCYGITLGGNVKCPTCTEKKI